MNPRRRRVREARRKKKTRREVRRKIRTRREARRKIRTRREAKRKRKKKLNTAVSLLPLVLPPLVVLCVNAPKMTPFAVTVNSNPRRRKAREVRRKKRMAREVRRK